MDYFLTYINKALLPAYLTSLNSSSLTVAPQDARRTLPQIINSKMLIHVIIAIQILLLPVCNFNFLSDFFLFN